MEISDLLSLLGFITSMVSLLVTFYMLGRMK